MALGGSYAEGRVSADGGGMDGWWAWVIGLERPKGTKDEVKRPFGPQLYDVLLPLDF